MQISEQILILDFGSQYTQLIARQNGIEPIEACTLVMLSTGQY